MTRSRGLRPPRPHSYPIGAERTTDKGYVWIKVREGHWPAAWRPKHHLVYEEHFGPIPEGHIVIFRDRDKTHFAPANLEAITQAQLAARNSIHRYPPEVIEVMRLIGTINWRVNHEQKRRKEAAHD
jgi:hypothetical protein